MAREAAAPTPGYLDHLTSFSTSQISRSISPHNARAQPRGPATTCTPLAEPAASTRGSKMLSGPGGCSALLWGVAAKLTTTPQAPPRVPPSATNDANRPAADGHRTSPDPGRLRA